MAKEQLEVETISVVADKGYESRMDILECIYDGTAPTVALKYAKKERNYELPYEEAEITEEERASTKREDMEKCLKGGVLPKIYEGTGISVEVQAKGKVSCFLRDEEGHVTCPMGHALRYSRKRGKCLIYKDREYCRACRNKCTNAEWKEVSFGPETDCVPVRMFGVVTEPVQEIPPDGRISPSNHTLDTGHVPKKEGRAADTGRQRKAKAANVSFGASVWNGEVVPRRPLFAVQGKGESRSGAGAEFPCLQHDESD